MSEKIRVNKQKALEIIQRESVTPVKGECPEMIHGAFDLAGFALSQRIAEPVYGDDQPQTASCPYCGSSDWLHNKNQQRNRFCGRCGKKLQWEEPEENA